MAQNRISEVFLTKTSDRSNGIRNLFNQYDLNMFSGRNVAIKANFNSADSFPASTHLKILEAIINELNKANAHNLTLAERSGMGNTKQVLEQLGVFKLSEELDFEVIVLDEEDGDRWVKIDRNGTHWLKGFYISRVFKDTERIVQTCCLKTHRFGGHFTLSLKNSVGLVAKKVPGGIYNYMAELHMSPYQRLMIAEINKFYDVDLIIMDAIDAFVTKGPEQGTIVTPNLLLASDDRVAIDAVGIAILRSYGATKNVMKGKIFELEQIKRAAELDVGVKSADLIKITPLNDESQEDAEKIEKILEEQG